MKKSHKIFTISFFIIIFIGSTLFYLTRLPSPKMEEFSEDNHSLFSQLDPLLGYAHNNYYVAKATDKEMHILFNNGEYIHYKNGFVGLSYKATENPIKIVILGTSSSDPFLFDGNWPLKFHHILIQKNIPHIIYNGAVSGYNSHQVLTKLIRDVFSLEKINLVISYFGGNDYISNEDISANHPAIHPYQDYLFRHLTLSTPIDLSILGKIKFFINKIRKKSINNLQLGIDNTNYIKNLVMNIQYMKAICDLNGVPYMHVIEGVITNESQRINGSKLTYSNQFLEKKILSFLSEAHSQFPSSKYVFSIQKNIPNKSRIFYDSVHLSSAGNQFLASEIFYLVRNLAGGPHLFPIGKGK